MFPYGDPACRKLRIVSESPVVKCLLRRLYIDEDTNFYGNAGLSRGKQSPLVPLGSPTSERCNKNLTNEERALSSTGIPVSLM